jgi:phage tail-like protein
MSFTAPFENRNFRVKWDGKFVAGVSKVSALRWTSQVTASRDGGSPIEQTRPGTIRFEPLALERAAGLDNTFGAWAMQVTADQPLTGTGYLKDLLLDIYDPTGVLVITYKIYRCWPSSFEAISVLDAEGNLTIVERLMLEYASFEKDLSVAPPTP